MSSINTSPKRKRVNLIVWLVVVATSFTTATGQTPSPDADQSIRMIRGLKDRRLFDLADKYGLAQLESETIQRIDKASILNELIRAKVVQAASLTGTPRAETWSQAHALVDDFLKSDQQHPRKLLVQVQDALTFYSNGNLIAQEIAAEIQSTDKRANALQEFRRAKKLFGTVDSDINRQLPIARSKTPAPGELNADELVNLQNNVRFQLARVDLARAEMFEVDDKLNRVDALQQVLARLDELSRQTNSDVPLWWQAQATRVHCLRLMNRYDQATSALKNLPDMELTDEINRMLLTQQILIAAETGKSSNDLLDSVKVLPRSDPQLSLAVLQWLMASAAQSQGAARKQFQQQAAQWVGRIENQHGAYWGRRAEILLVGSIEPADPTTSNVAEGDFQILIRQADNAFRKGNFSDAGRAYDKAAGIAQASGNAKDTVYLTVRQAQCYENNKDHGSAANELFEVAKEFPQQTNTAAVHLRGCWNFAKILNNNSERKNEFVVHLKRQAELWPLDEPSNQARLWLGDHYQNEKQWESAIQAYLSVAPESSKSLTAAEQISASIKRWSKNKNSGDRRMIAEKIDGLVGIRFKPSSKVTWSDTERTLLLDWLDAGLVRGSLSAEDGLALLETASTGVGEEQGQWLQLAKVREFVFKMKQGSAEPELAQAVGKLPKSSARLKTMILLIDDSLTVEEKTRYAQAMTLISDRALSDPGIAQDFSFWQLRKAESSLSSGRAEEVVSDLESLASQNPKSLEIQLAYCRVLSQLPPKSAEAMKQWRKLAAKVKPGTDAWYESKFNVVKLMIADGKLEEAKKLVEYLKATTPAWSASNWNDKFVEILSGR